MNDLLARIIPLRTPLVVLLGVLLFVPSLAVPFTMDDWFHVAVIEESELMPDRGPLDLFSFVRGGDNYGEVQGDVSPWWADGTFAASFFRPLTSLTHYFDHQVFGRFVPGHHATSLLLWLLLLLATLRLFEALGRDSARGGGVVLLAGLFYALDDAHTWGVVWLAARNSLLCALFCVLSLHSYHRFRRDGRMSSLAASLALYAIGLCAGEAAVVLPFWVLAYELCLSDDSIGSRLRASLPVYAGTAFYLVGWHLSGAGTAGSSLYLDPFSDPVPFVVHAVTERIPLLIMGALTAIPAELPSIVLPGHMTLLLPIVFAVCVACVAVLWPLLRRDRMCRFLAVGALFSMLPMCATFAHNRLLTVVTVGTAWILACYVVDCAASLRAAKGRELPARLAFRTGVAVLILLCHLAIAPAAVGLGTWGLAQIGGFGEKLALTAAIPKDAAVSESRVLILNSPDPVAPTYLALIRSLSDLPTPAAAWSVSIVPGDQVLTRTGPNSFTLEVDAPGFLDTLWERLFRSSPEVEKDQLFERGALTVRAVEVVDDRLRKIEVSVDLPLDDPRVVLLAWDGERLDRVVPPAVGECRLLPLDGYHDAVPIPSHPKMGRVCAEEAEFYGKEEPVGGVAGPSSRPCTLELWDAESKEWTPRDKLQCPADGKLRLLSAGDMGRAGVPLNKSVAGMQRACAEKDCQLLLMPGDLIYGPGARAKNSWRRAWDEGLARLDLPTLAVLGNHEYRHETDPEMKRDVLYASDKHLRLVLPAGHYAARLVAGDEVLLAFAGLDTDSLVPSGQHFSDPGLGVKELNKACKQEVPVVVVGHHPPSSQGYHHREESKVERMLRSYLVKTVEAGCNIVVVAAGHDHDLQAYGPGCEEKGAPAVVVAGATARGYRKRGSTHLETCPVGDAQSSYHAGLGKAAGGFAILDLDLARGQADALLIYTPELDKSEVKGVVSWQFPVR